MLTRYVILAVVCLLAVYDVWATHSSKAPTLSHELYNLAVRFPVIPFVLGFLLGHVFWPLHLVYSDPVGK